MGYGGEAVRDDVSKSMKKQDRYKSELWEINFVSEGEENISIKLQKIFSAQSITIHFSSSSGRVMEFLLDRSETEFLVDLLDKASREASKIKPSTNILSIGTLDQQNQHFMFVRASALYRAIYIGLAQSKGTDMEFALTLKDCKKFSSFLEEANS
jgi:hypothetical protein